MATTNTWDQVVSKITGVANRGAFSKTYTPSTSRQTQNGSAGYYSSITTVCNAVSLSGNASTSQVLTGRTFYTTSLTKQTGTMPNRGNLNWSGSNTTYSVPAGYYSGGTLDSRTSYNNGYNSGVNAGKGALSIGVAWCNSTYGISGSLPGTILSTRTLGHNGLIVAISQIDVDYDCGVSINGGTPVIAHTNQYGGARIRVRANRVNSNTQFNVMNDYTEHYYSGTIIVLYIS